MRGAQGGAFSRLLSGHEMVSCHWVVSWQALTCMHDRLGLQLCGMSSYPRPFLRAPELPSQRHEQEKRGRRESIPLVFLSFFFLLDSSVIAF